VSAQRSYAAQAARLVADASAVYSIDATWTQRRLASIRLVVTRISSIADTGYFASMAQVGGLALEGASFVAPVSQRIFTVNGGESIVVDLKGRVGIGLGSNALPRAAFHVAVASNLMDPESPADAAFAITSRETGRDLLSLHPGSEPGGGGLTMVIPSGRYVYRAEGVDGPEAMSITSCNVQVGGSVSGALSDDVRLGVMGTARVYGSDMIVDSNVRSGGDAFFGGGTLTLREGDTRLMDRLFATSNSFIRGLRFRMKAEDGGAEIRDGYVADLSSLSLATAGLMMMGDDASTVGDGLLARAVTDGTAGSARHLLHLPTHLTWTGFAAASNLSLSLASDAPSRIEVVASGSNHVIEWYGSGLGASGLPPPEVLEPFGDDLAEGYVRLLDAETEVVVDLYDRFVDDAPEYVPWSSSRATLSFEVLGTHLVRIVEPIAPFPAAVPSDGKIRLVGGYTDTSNAYVTVRATSAASGLSTEAPVPVWDAAPPPPLKLRQLGQLDQPVAPVEYALDIYFEDATRPSSGLVYTLEADPDETDPYAVQAAADAASIVAAGGNVLRIAPDHRAVRYRVVVRATCVDYPASTTTMSLTVTEPWPVQPRASPAGLGSVTLADNYTAVTYAIDPDGQPYFFDAAQTGLVFTLETDPADSDAATLADTGERGYALLEDLTWNRLDAFSGASTTARAAPVTTARDAPGVPGLDEAPVFPSESPYWTPATSVAQVLTLVGDYRDRTYDVIVTATSVGHPQRMSARARLTVTEPGAPPPLALVSSLGSITLDWITTERTFDLNAAYEDVGLRGMAFEIASNPFGSASLDPDGHTLRVVGGFRGAAASPYAVSVVARTLPYGTATAEPLVLEVSESDPAPSLAADGTAEIGVAVAANAPDALRVPLEPRVDAIGALTFRILSVLPVSYESVYVDPGENDLVVEGIDDTEVSYTVRIRATDAFDQHVDFDVPVHNRAPPAAVAQPDGPHVVLMTTVLPTQSPIVFYEGALKSYFVDPVVRFSIAVDPHDSPPRATYNSSNNSVTVTYAPATVSIYGYDDLGQSSALPYVIRVV
jgi:hypothetical protein